MQKMCEQTELNYLDGDVVWVKLGSCWWPGEVVCPEKLPADVLPSFRKPPIAVVKFFQEDSYEYVKNHNAIYKYECSRKNEFIQKGLYLYRTKHGLMEKFPEDVIRAETAVGGDNEILTRDEFQEAKKESYADLFGDPRKKTPGSSKKGKSIKGRSPDISKSSTLLKKIKEKTNYQVHILVQSSKAPSQAEETTPSTSRTGSEPPEDKIQESKIELSKPVLSCSTPTVSSPGIYACHACPFTTSRLNVLILHNKTHSATFSPYIPSPPKKKTLKTTKSPKPLTTPQKPRKPRQEKLDEKLSKKHKRVAEDKNDTLHEVKKAKTDEEIKTSLLADWDDGDEDSNEESSTIAMAGSPDVPVAAGSPAVPVAAGSPAVPTSAELPSALVSCESEPTYEIKKNIILPSEKPETSNDAKYDFCEDEDWPVEADVGRKIPRVKPLIRKEETKSLSIDENDMAREVAELLNKTTVPELPSAPEPLKVEENFPEPSIVKSPDKKSEKSPEHSSSPEKKVDSDVQPSKTIFKTKTFFRSRHSRSQDAIGKYVAEQLNAAERLDSIDNDTNGSEMIPSPEPRITSPIEHVKVARLAPKIQLKKMKAEAEQLRQREKCESDNILKELINPPKIETLLKDNVDLEVNERENKETFHPDHTLEQSSDIKSSDIGGYETTASIIVNEHNDSVITSDSTIKEVPNLENSTSNAESTYQTVTEKNQENLNKETYKPYESYMNDSTASAVDALLSVSREADRVTKVISVGPPEDLFEDDNKDSAGVSDINGCDKGFNEDVEGINSPVQPPVSESVNPIIEVLPSNIESQPMQAISEIIIPTKIENFENEDSLKNEINIPELSVSGQSNKEEFKEDMQFNPNDLDSQKEGEIETQKEIVLNNLPNSTPSESDLQIAEALINLPSTTIQNKISIECQDQVITLSPVNNDQIPTKEIIVNTVSFQQSSITPPITIENLHEEKKSLSNSPTLTNNIRFESEEEKSENLNAAQSLVQMSESIDHKITVTDIKTTSKSDVGSRVYSNKKEVKCVDNKMDIKLNEKATEITTDKLNGNTVQVEKTSKLLKILEEPCTSRVSVTNNAVVNKKVILPSKEKTLNFDVNQSTNKPKQATNQKIIIRRTATPHKTLLNNITEVTTPDKIILSRTNKPSEDGSSVQSYTIQTTPDVKTDKNTIIIQQKIRKIAKPAPKFQKIKPQTTTVSTINNKISKEVKPTDTVFDINSMPIVLSDDILTPESIEKMPIVMSDGNIITSPSTTKIKNKKVNANNEKMTVTSSCNKQDVKQHAAHDVNKVTTPNILSKSSKVRSPKPVLVIDKTTGKQKFIMNKPDPPIKEVKQQPKLIQTIPQSSKAEKFVILPSPASPRPQKIVIDPQTGKAHVVVGKGPTTPIVDNKPVSAKLIPSASDTKAPGNTVMIITNAQGTQSRIVLTPEHEKILFPNKQQPNVSQLKTIAHRISTNSSPQQKSLVTTVASVKTPSRIVSKQQKSAIITSKGQLLVGGRLTATTQNIAPLPEIRPATKRVATEPKKLAPVIQKTEPLIFLQKSGAVMQLTAAQFEHLQRTGQIIQKVSIPQQENKVVAQKPIAMSSTETLVPVQKQRARKQQTESSTLIKKFKHEIAIAPAPAPTPMPALTPIVSTTTNMSVAANVNISNNIAAPSTYSNMPNFEELLPTSTIVRPNETVVSQPEQIAQTPTAPLSDGQLLAVPGEHFGGPQGSFYLCVEENGTFTPIDNRPLVLENNQLVPMPESIPVLTPQPERRDILEAALANSDVFHAESSRDEAPDFRDLNANVSVHCRVSETSTTLNQPIMTPVEVPTKGDSEPVVPSNLDDGLAVIGVTPHTVPTSLELPITVTDPRIAPKTTDPLSNNNYRPSLLPSPNTEMTFVVTEGTDVSVVGPISMPLLTEEESVGKSMPILIDEITERTVSSVESTVGSPSSIDVRESETEDGSQWPRRLLTPGSDISEASVEIPLQPAIQLSVSDLSHNS